MNKDNEWIKFLRGEDSGKPAVKVKPRDTKKPLRISKKQIRSIRNG
jgi:hypothetical protein